MSTNIKHKEYIEKARNTDLVSIWQDFTPMTFVDFVESLKRGEFEPEYTDDVNADLIKAGFITTPIKSIW